MKTKQIIIAVLAVVCVLAVGIVYMLSYGKEDKENSPTFFGESEVTSDAVTEALEPEKIYVYVCGQVNNPGVVCLSGDARIYQAIEAAGGLTDMAAEGLVNQAELLVDGQMVYVPMLGEDYTVAATEGDSKVNINTASKDELMTLPGIGESKASDIINYRDSAGGFQTIEDIMQISGIKEAAFEKIKDYIKV